MLGLATLYGICLMSGFLLERRFSVGSLIERIMVVVSVGAAQLLLSIQILSLKKWLTGGGLLAANVILLCIIYVLFGREKVPPTRVSSATLVLSSWEKIKAQRKDPILVISGLVALLLIGISWAFGVALIPFGDGYHYDMPLFWRQHQSILPFAVSDPRVVATSFAGEALSLPGYIFYQTDKMGAVIVLPAALLCIWLIFSISRQLGCSSAAAGFSSILAVGYTEFVASFTSMYTEIFLAMMWSGASILFLLKTSTPEKTRSIWPTLGWSVLCFALACGAKNTVILSAPLVLICTAIVLRHSLNRKEVWTRLILIGVISLVCSGVIWNYTSNKLWFGNLRGPLFMQKLHQSREFQLHSMWTRLARGSIMFLFDTNWVPESKQDMYVDVSINSLKFLGAHAKLAEDDEDFRDLRPRMGFGLLGIFIFLPGVFLGLLRCFGISQQTQSQDDSVCLKTALLVLMTVGTFVLVHLMLRSTTAGHFRIMPFFLMSGAPLAATLLERQKNRIAGLILLIITAIIFLRIDVKRHLGWEPDNILLQAIFNQSKNDEITIEYTWTGYGPRKISMDESHVDRALYSTFLSGINKPSVIGFVSCANSLSSLYYLFGKDFTNRIIPLTDTRNPGMIQNPTNDIEYIIFYEYKTGSCFKIDEWALKHKFTPVFRATINGECIFTALKKEPSDTMGKINPNNYNRNLKLTETSLPP